MMKIFLLLLIGAFLHSAEAMKKKKKGSKLAKIFKVLTLGLVAQIASNSTPNNFVCQDVHCVDDNYFLNASTEYPKLRECPPMPKDAENLLKIIICHETRGDFQGRKYLYDLPDIINEGGVDKCQEHFKAYWENLWGKANCSKMMRIPGSIYEAAKLRMFGKEPTRKLERQMIKDGHILVEGFFRQPMTREVQKEKFEDFLNAVNIEEKAALKLAKQFDEIEADFYTVLVQVQEIGQIKPRITPTIHGDHWPPLLPVQQNVEFVLKEYWNFQRFNEKNKQKQKELEFKPEKIYEDKNEFQIYF